MSYGNDLAPAVLIVEDDPAISRLIKLTLEADEIDSLVAATGEEALQLLDEGGSGVVVLDMRLPDGDGGTLVPLLKQEYGVSVVVLTASSNSAVRRAAFASGADEFCLKPFDPDELADRIRFLATPETPPAEDAVEIAHGIEASFTARRVWRDGQPVRISRTHWDMLSLLVSRAGADVSPIDLATRVPGGWPDDTLIEALVGELNQRLAPGKEPLIRTAETGFSLPAFKPSA